MCGWKETCLQVHESVEQLTTWELFKVLSRFMGPMNQILKFKMSPSSTGDENISRLLIVQESPKL